MSRKCFVIAGLLCLLAAPVFAAPTVNITSGGLNAQGDWIWNVTITNSDGGGGLPPSGSSPLATELGFNLTVADLLNATRTNQATNFDTLNPGNIIFDSWQTNANGLLDSTSNNKPTGIQTQCPSGTCSTESRTTPVGLGSDSSVVGAVSQVFAALGSIDYNTLGPHDFIQIITNGPTGVGPSPPTSTRKSVIEMLGEYTAGGATGGNTGRIAELLTATTATNHNGYAATMYALAQPGDTDLVLGVNLDDFNTVVDNIGKPRYWQGGNFHANDGSNVNLDDFNTVVDAIGLPSGGSGSGVGPGAGAGGGLGSGGAVPEPTSLVLLGLGIIPFLAGRRR